MHHRLIWVLIPMLQFPFSSVPVVAAGTSVWLAALAPGPRQGHTLAFDSRRGVVVLFGGAHRAGANGETREWDGTSWQLRTRLGPSGRAHHAMAYDSLRGVVVLFGGLADGQLFGDTWEWNGDRWTLRATDGPSPRYGHSMAYDENRHVVVLFGGWDSPALSAETWEWNGTKWALRSTTGPSPRRWHAMTFDSVRERTVLFGGQAQTSQNNAETWEWDGSQWALRPVSGPSARFGHAQAYDAVQGVVVLFGGYTASGFNRHTWEWDGATWVLRSTSGPSPRRAHALCYDAVGERVLLVGGFDGDPLGDTWQWAGGNWVELQAPGPGPRAYHSSAYNRARGLLVLFGGLKYENARYKYYGDTWLWDGQSWARGPTNGPAPRASHTMVYDDRRGVIVLFGGYFSDPLGAPYTYFRDTWEWDGASWTLRATTGPPAASERAMAYDSGRGVSVLFGGGDVTTWEWDGGQWAASAAAAPYGYGWRGSAMTYDPIRNVVLLFGGYYREYQQNWIFHDGTWAYDGTSWQRLPVSGPGGRARHSLTFDSSRGVAVLFGGWRLDSYGRFLFHGDAWEWDGTRWVPRSPTGATPRAGHSTTFDEENGWAVLHGGSGSYGYLGDTWLYGLGRPADFDGDGDIDLRDFLLFQECFDGSGNPPAGTCPPGVDADLDADGDVDLADFLIFQQNFTGSR